MDIKHLKKNITLLITKNSKKKKNEISLQNKNYIANKDKQLHQKINDIANLKNTLSRNYSSGGRGNKNLGYSH